VFIDQASIHVKAGNGGHGCVSFRREKFKPKGGPDGGDGGRGGNLYFMAVDDLDTLIDFAGKHHWKAKSGEQGSSNNKHGISGEDLILRVPKGTLLYDTDIDLMIKDMIDINEKVCVCRGGLGGRGNKHFAGPTNQTPRFATPGRVGQERNLRLELKLIADVGLLGLPNAGKSTLISRCSGARPKIADYPFTTLEPVLGIVELSDYRRFVIADIPGIIQGAHGGAGLGFEFLRHIERTSLLAHVLDIAPEDGSDPVDNYHSIRNELHQYSQALAQKPEIIVANKIDLDHDNTVVDDLKKRLEKEIHPISAVTGAGMHSLSELFWQRVKQIRTIDP
jgi:GTP-binding protein